MKEERDRERDITNSKLGPRICFPVQEYAPMRQTKNPYEIQRHQAQNPHTQNLLTATLRILHTCQKLVGTTRDSEARVKSGYLK